MMTRIDKYAKMEERQQNLHVQDGAPCPDSAYASQALPSPSSGSVVANRTPGPGEGFLVPEQLYFRHWAHKHLLSDSLASLTDHEERVWWRLLAAASLEADRWFIENTPGLARKCMSTPKKLDAALGHFVKLGMVELLGSTIFVTGGARLNEERNGRPPSASPERVGARVTKHRNAKRNEAGVTTPVTSVTTPVTRYSNDHKEEEQEQEKEQEAAAAAGSWEDQSVSLREKFEPVMQRFKREYQEDLGLRAAIADLVSPESRTPSLVLLALSAFTRANPGRMPFPKEFAPYLDELDPPKPKPRPKASAKSGFPDLFSYDDLEPATEMSR